MSWIYLDDGFADHPKILAITDGALRLHIAALCYAGRHLTDGHVPAEVVGRRISIADRLVKADLWDVDPAGGWRIHDYLDYQRSSEQVRKDRAAATARQRRNRQGKRP